MIPTFQSATLKLTGWYLAILMSISLLFSAGIYQLNYHEINIRLENLQHELVKLPGTPTLIISSDEVREAQSQQAAFQMAITLLYINIAILVTGGVGSYFLARRTLRPLEKAHQAQSRFVSDASHELRTPLAAMKAEIEVAIRDKQTSQKELEELLVSNLEEVNNLTRLSEALLSLSRLEDHNLTKEKLNLSEIINDSLKSFKKHRARINVSKRKQAYVYGNRETLVELMNILLDNSIKYSPDKSKINIVISQKTGNVIFKITNTGKPISADILPRLFERFYRADESRTKSGKTGHGLGLAIAKQIIEAHNGTIDASHSNGKTSFCFKISVYRKNFTTK